MGLYEDLNRLSLQAIGARPQWELIGADDCTGRPGVASDGVYLEDSPSTLVSVALRPKASGRRCDVTVTTFDATATYTVTINGTAFANVTPTDADNLLTELRDAIVASAVVGQAAATPLVNAQCLDAAGDDVATSGEDAVTLRVYGDEDNGVDYSIAIAATGTGVLACVADPVSCSLDLWALLGGVAKDGAGNDPNEDEAAWRYIASATYAVTSKGRVERYDTAGIDRLYVQLSSIAGHASDGGTVTLGDPIVHVGPAVVEE